jgi:predicted metal-binding membrane protein
VAILTGLAGITTAAWVYVVLEAHRMTGMSIGMSDHSMAASMHAVVGLQPWTVAEFGGRLVMWAVMMVAMMVPTAVPMTLVYAAVARKAAVQSNPVAPTFVFVAGYVVIWSLFSVAATAAQLELDRAALLSPMMVSNSVLLGSALLIGAGVYELTPLKHSCLRHCRAPAQFLSHNWRSGTIGAFRMGLRLGAYCLGCCWVLMGLLFVGGVMNLLWIAAISAFVLLEKILPFGHAAGWFAGAAMILVGARATVRAAVAPLRPPTERRSPAPLSRTRATLAASQEAEPAAALPSRRRSRSGSSPRQAVGLHLATSATSGSRLCRSRRRSSCATSTSSEMIASGPLREAARDRRALLLRSDR